MIILLRQWKPGTYTDFSKPATYPLISRLYMSNSGKPGLFINNLAYYNSLISLIDSLG